MGGKDVARPSEDTYRVFQREKDIGVRPVVDGSVTEIDEGDPA